MNIEHCDIISPRVFTPDTSTEVERIQPITADNQVVVDSITGVHNVKDQPCEKCGMYPHPVTAVRDLPPELQSECPILDRHSFPVAETKRRRVTLEVRAMSNEDMVKQMKAKEEGGNRTTTKKKVKHT